MHTGGATLCQHSQRPGKGESSCHPESGVGGVPGSVAGVRKGNHVLLKVNIFQMHPLTSLHVIVQALVLCKEPGSLGQVGVFRLHVGKAKALGEPQPSDSKSLQA